MPDSRDLCYKKITFPVIRRMMAKFRRVLRREHGDVSSLPQLDDAPTLKTAFQALQS
jgi:hypothetical protein